MQRITLPVNEFNCKSSAILESDLGDTDDIIYKLFLHIDTFRSFEDASKESQKIIKNSAKLSWLANS